MRPIRDLTEGANRVAAGDYSQRLPYSTTTTSESSATFNRMQQGLAERRRLHTAFGTYVDPAPRPPASSNKATTSFAVNTDT